VIEFLRFLNAQHVRVFFFVISVAFNKVEGKLIRPIVAVLNDRGVSVRRSLEVKLVIAF
jgi:hypothetical protein